MEKNLFEECFARFLWCQVYASVIGGEKENDETAFMQANTAVTRYAQAWGEKGSEGGQDGRNP